MAFGLIQMEERELRPRPERKEPMEKVQERREAGGVAAASRLHILLLGRNLSILQEFLCSMNENTSEALSGQGLAFYTRELDSISSLIARKKRLEQFCWSFSSADWSYPEDDEAERTYMFTVSPSGSQDRALDLVIRCVTPKASFSWADVDAVWLLSDGALLHDPGDPFLDVLRGALEELSSQEDAVPACLIVSQLEELGRFGGVGGQSLLPSKVSAQITTLCRETFLADCPAAIIPVQVYGGMECAGMDEKHDPVLRIGSSSFYQSYVPDNCQIPCLYTIQAICSARSADYFVDTAESGLLRGIRSHYSGKFGDPQWAPELLRGRDET